MFNIMKIELSSGYALLMSRQDGEVFLNILQRSLIAGYGSNTRADKNVKVTLLRLVDLSEVEQGAWCNGGGTPITAPAEEPQD